MNYSVVCKTSNHVDLSRWKFQSNVELFNVISENTMINRIIISEYIELRNIYNKILHYIPFHFFKRHRLFLHPPTQRLVNSRIAYPAGNKFVSRARNKANTVESSLKLR